MSYLDGLTKKHFGHYALLKIFSSDHQESVNLFRISGLYWQLTLFVTCRVARIYLLSFLDDFRSWESPQTLPSLFIGPFEHVERFRNLKFAVIRITNIQSIVLSSSEDTAAIHLAFK